MRNPRRVRGAGSEAGPIVAWPPVQRAEDLGDLLARVMWAVPIADARRPVIVPIRVTDGVGALTDVGSPPHLLTFDVSALRCSLVAAAHEIDRAFASASLLAVWRASSLLEPRVIANRHRTVVVDHHFSHPLDLAGWMEIVQRTLPPAVQSRVSEASRRNFARLIARGAGCRTANLFGKGPSVTAVWEHDVASDFNVICNSMVRDRALLAHIRPHVVACCDPVYCFGPSLYSMRFREDLRRAAHDHDLFIVTNVAAACLLCAHYPDLEGHVIGVLSASHMTVPTVDALYVAPYHNVLTQLMIPVALAIDPDAISFWGCDGAAGRVAPAAPDGSVWPRAVSVDYDELKWTVTRAHPACFRDTVPREYQGQHEAELHQAIAFAESRRVVVRCCTPSFLPALSSRLSPPERHQPAPAR